MVEMLAVFFFFSSRRRHTRLVSDWSSDVCSSDLSNLPGGGLDLGAIAKPIGDAISAAADHGPKDEPKDEKPDNRDDKPGEDKAGERSEERRVGKECRSGWARGGEEKEETDGQGGE